MTMNNREYTNRTYRQHLRQERWYTFTIVHKETDLWIGIDKASYREEIRAYALSRVIRLRQEMDTYLNQDPEYRKALIPYTPRTEAPAIIRKMAEVSDVSGIGPMSAVAGAVAGQIAAELKTAFPIREIIIENGGDIYADIHEDIDIAVFAGSSPLSEKVGFTIRADRSPLGICTSSGTVGPSLSFGQADAVMIVCQDCALADTYATAFANQIQTTADIEPCIEKIGDIPKILAAICIKDTQIGISGKFDFKIWK